MTVDVTAGTIPLGSARVARSVISMPKFKISWGGSLTLDAEDEEDAWNKFDEWTETDYAKEISGEPRIEEVKDDETIPNDEDPSGGEPEDPE